MIAATGWSWEYIDECLTLPRLYAITGKWTQAPPVHRLIADYLGVKREQAPKAEVVNDFDALQGVMGFTIG